VKAGGRVEFERLPTGHWIVSRWSIRMPETAIQRRMEGVSTYARVEDRIVAEGIRVRGGQTLDIQRSGATLYHSERPDFAVTDSARVVAAQRLASGDPMGRELTRGGDGAVLRGRVTEAGDTVGVPGAQVELVETGTLRWADKHGEFRFFGVPRGTYQLRVRLLGYQPWLAAVVLEEGGVYDRNIELRRVAFALTEVRIEGRAVKVPARFEEAYRRGARGFGTLIDRAEIERLNPVEVKSLFYRIPGVMVSDRGINFQRCESGLDGLSPAGGPAKQSAAKVQVYIDGIRMTRPGPLPTVNPGKFGSPVDEGDAEHVLRLVPPTAIQVIEVYRGVSQIPAEFLDDACAVIAIWTKSY
jgi:hypothetical protein